MRPCIKAAFAVLGATFLWTAAVHAEVRGLTDRRGLYRGTEVVLINGGVWTPADGRVFPGTLNPVGDILGDQWPVILESPQPPNHPWAVWSRLNDGEYDLAWSRWLGPGWQGVTWLAPSDHLGDDLDADLAYDASGRPHLIWWRNERDLGRIYFSLFLMTHWMEPLVVSEAEVDSRHPTLIGIAADGEILITYETPSGFVQQTIQLQSGVGITDDIDPLNHVTVDAPQHIEEHSN